MKLWGSSLQLGVHVDAATEAEMRGAARFLGDALFISEPCPDPKARLTPGEMGLLQLFVETTSLMAGVAFKITGLPPSSGYEQLLKQKGYNTIRARGLAYLFRRSGERQAKEQQLRPKTVKAIRELGNIRPHAKVLDNAKFVVQVANVSSIVDTICCEVGLREMDLIPLLRDLVDGKPFDRKRIAEVVLKLGPALSVPRGPKISAASAAHEFILENGLPSELGCSAYTLSGSDGDFTDPLTQATRREFGNPDFDPRPAYRRVKKRQLAKLG